MLPSKGGIFEEFNRRYATLTKSVQHYKSAKKGYSEVAGKVTAIRKELDKSKRNYDKAKASNANENRIVMMETEMQNLNSQLKTFEPELKKKSKMAKEARKEVDRNRERFEEISEEASADQANKSRVDALRNPDNMKQFDLSSFKEIETLSGHGSKNIAENLLRELMFSRDSFTKSEIAESKCIWELRNINQELNMINRALLTVSNSTRGKRYEAIENLKTTLEKSSADLKAQKDGYFKVKLASIHQFKELRQKYFEVTNLEVDFPDTSEAHTWLHKTTEIRKEISDIVEDFLLNPSDDEEINQESQIEDEVFDFSTGNFDTDMTATSFVSNLVRSKMEMTKNSLLQQKSLSTPQHNQVRSFSEITIGDDFDDKTVHTIFLDDNVSFNPLHSTMFEPPPREEPVVASLIALPEAEILDKMCLYSKWLEEGSLKLKTLKARLYSKTNEEEREANTLTRLTLELLEAEAEYSSALIDLENKISELVDFGMRVLVYEGNYQATTVGIVKMWLKRADMQAEYIEETKRILNNNYIQISNNLDRKQ